MPSPFDDLDAAVSAEVLGVFGETVTATLRPAIVSQYRGRVADPARAASALPGVFSAGPGEGPIRGLNSGEFTGVTRLASYAAEFWVSAAGAAALGFEVRKGDLIEFPGRAGAPTFFVSVVQRTDMGDLNLLLVAEDPTEADPPEE